MNAETPLSTSPTQTRQWAPNAEIMMFVVLVLLMLFSLRLGRYPISLPHIVQALWDTHQVTTQQHNNWVIINIIRLPRIAGVALCGMGLGLAGTTLQGVFRNPLVGPEICGVSAGATFGGSLALVLGGSMVIVIGLAFSCGMLALIIAILLSCLSKSRSTLPLILSGVIVGGFFSSLTGLIQYVADPQIQLPSIIYWLLGSFVGMTWNKVALLASVTLVCGTLLLLLRWRLNLLSLDDTDAQTLGLHVEKLRWSVIALSALLVAAQIAVSGCVGFAGLIVPHLTRMVVGPEHTRLLPASACFGGIYLLLVDDLARSLTTQEIPIGLLTSFIGAPIFAWLFWKVQQQGAQHVG